MTSMFTDMLTKVPQRCWPPPTARLTGQDWLWNLSEATERMSNITGPGWHTLHPLHYEVWISWNERRAENADNWSRGSEFCELCTYICMCCSEVLIGWWSCQVQDRVVSACTLFWKSCTSKLEPAKSGGSSDTFLGYYANESKFLLRSVTHEYVNRILPQILGEMITIPRSETGVKILWPKILKYANTFFCTSLLSWPL